MEHRNKIENEMKNLLLLKGLKATVHPTRPTDTKTIIHT